VQRRLPHPSSLFLFLSLSVLEASRRTQQPAAERNHQRAAQVHLTIVFPEYQRVCFPFCGGGRRREEPDSERSRRVTSRASDLPRPARFVSRVPPSSLSPVAVRRVFLCLSLSILEASRRTQQPAAERNHRRAAQVHLTIVFHDYQHVCFVLRREEEEETDPSAERSRRVKSRASDLRRPARFVSRVPPSSLPPVAVRRVFLCLSLSILEGRRRRRTPQPAAERNYRRAAQVHLTIVFPVYVFVFFFFNDTAATEISTLSLHDALPI
jgi:hypothetical protein